MLNAMRHPWRSRAGLLAAAFPTGAIDITFEPRNPNVLYASLWQTRRTPWSVYPPSNGPGSGLFKSTDGGETWREITRNPGLPPGLIGKITIGISGADASRIFGANLQTLLGK